MMFRLLIALLLATGLSACSNAAYVARNVSAGPAAPEAVAQRNYRVVGLDVYVPYSLTVSEANRYYPGTDIVWRGDPPGDRHKQVHAIVRSAAERATAGLNGWQDVRIAIEVTRFHSLTEKSRYTIGGVHGIYFLIAVYDARTGAVIEPPRQVNASLMANGGGRAIEADWMGRTPKARLHDHLAGVIQRELTPPYGYATASFGGP